MLAAGYGSKKSSLLQVQKDNHKGVETVKANRKMNTQM
ncbi:hypothetical protein EJ110_NYTH11100 [Nymphaea thermarum]|nr:hypothetical protein EJ110_NYTH11100 [Nymphaea thermarum]